MKIYTLLITIVFFLAACTSSPGHSSDQAPAPPPAPGTASTEQKADLVVTNVEINPQVIKAGTPSALNVYVANNGNIQSGEYDLSIWSRHVGNANEAIGCCPPVHRNGQAPGEALNVYTGTVNINDAGQYELVIIIKLADGTTTTKVWPFSGVSAN